MLALNPNNADHMLYTHPPMTYVSSLAPFLHTSARSEGLCAHVLSMPSPYSPCCTIGLIITDFVCAYVSRY